VLLQAYVIATSTLVDISKVDVSKFDDVYFKSSDKAEKKKGEDGFFETQTEKKELGSEYIENQKKVCALSTSSMHYRADSSCSTQAQDVGAHPMHFIATASSHSACCKQMHCQGQDTAENRWAGRLHNSMTQIATFYPYGMTGARSCRA